MDAMLKEKITDKLRVFLNREPSEAEIINGQTDANLRQWIAQDDANEQNAAIIALAQAANVDISSVAPTIISPSI